MKVNGLILIVAILCIVAGLWAESYPPDGWRVSVPLVQEQYAQQYPDVTPTDNAIHTIWIDNRDGYYRLYYKKSTDEGFTWSDATMISASNTLANARRIISISGIGDDLYVAYVCASNPTESPYSVAFCRSSNNGETWTGYCTIESDLEYLPELAIAAADDSIRLVYRQCHNYIRYQASGDKGEEWTEDDIECALTPDYAPDIVIVNNIPHIVFVCATIENETPIGYLLHAMPFEEEWMISPIRQDIYYEFSYPHIAVDNQGYLYVLAGYQYTGGESPPPPNIHCWYSEDDGENWDGGGPGYSSNGWDLSVVDAGQIIITYGATDGDSCYLYCVFGEFSCGVYWSDPLKLANTTYAMQHSCIAGSDFGQHVIFHTTTQGGGIEATDLEYIAMDDSLLSDTPEATAFNSGIHLVRDIFSSSLHLTYQSQDRVHYSFSNDDGSTWSPYYILEDPETGLKEKGSYSSIGLNPGFFACDPCVVFVDDENQVKYRYRDIGGDWQGFTILPDVGLEPGPPALATYGGDVFVVFSVMSWLGRDDFVSAVLFYQFSSTASEPPEPDILDQANDGRLYGSMVSITVDGNGNPHVAWSKKPTLSDPEDIFYRWRDGSDSEDWVPALGQDPFLVSYDQDDAPSAFPHIEDYGDNLSVVWWYDGDYQIYRRRKDIPEDEWDYKFPCSEENAICEYPVNAADEFTVWCEMPDDQFDIRDTSDTYGYGWVSQAPENEWFCHSQLQRDYTPWDLYTIFTRGDEIPYRIVCVHQQFGIQENPGKESPFYTVKTGKELASAFCQQRDGAISYGDYFVDYANSELIYVLSLLEALFPFHKIRGTIYFEGDSDKTHEIWINGQKKMTLTVKPKQAYDFEILIPRELYQTTHRVTVSIKNPQNSGVYLAGLKVYRSIDGRAGGGGPQSAGSNPLMSQVRLVLTPNPFSKLTNISCNVAQSAESYTLKIYDITGRLVRSFCPAFNIQDTMQFSWDGCDDNGRHLSSGIYFVELKSGNQSATEKVTKLR